MDVIQPYVKSVAVFTDPTPAPSMSKCPAAAPSAAMNLITNIPYAAENGGYAMNTAYYNSTTGHPPTPIPDVPGNNTRTLAQLADPAGTIWVVDFINGYCSFQCVWPAGVQLPIITTVTPRTLGAGGYLRELHQGRVNTLFTDGHSKTVTLDYMTETTKTGPNTGAYCHWSVEDDCN